MKLTVEMILRSLNQIRRVYVDRLQERMPEENLSPNEISILIPCHRVVGTNGSLTGYAGGIDKKAKLLTLEKIRMEHLFPPTNYSLTPSTR